MLKTRKVPLILALLAAPALAGVVGGALVWLAITLPLLPEQGLDETMLVLMIGMIPAVVVAVMVTYVLGGPAMLVGWAIAHFMKWRSPAQMGITLGVTGLVFAFLFFLIGRLGDDTGIDADAFVLLATLPCGFIAGFLGGWIIGAFGYEQPGANETVQAGEA
ncbi:hypothetical protein [Glycocaulis sp.]